MFWEIISLIIWALILIFAILLTPGGSKFIWKKIRWVIAILIIVFVGAFVIVYLGKAIEWFGELLLCPLLKISGRVLP
ncbi:MAG: hypothetical protein ABIG10_02060 [bacterium]